MQSFQTRFVSVQVPGLPSTLCGTYAVAIATCTSLLDRQQQAPQVARHIMDRHAALGAEVAHSCALRVTFRDNGVHPLAATAAVQAAANIIRKLEAGTLALDYQRMTKVLFCTAQPAKVQRRLRERAMACKRKRHFPPVPRHKRYS
jgi:hypothetical protein